MATPHKVVGGVLDSVDNGLQRFGSSIKKGAQDIGHSVQTVLDAPFKAVLHRESPAHVPGDVLDGGLDATDEFYNRGMWEPLKTFGHGIERALDRPINVLGGMGRK